MTEQHVQRLGGERKSYFLGKEKQALRAGWSAKDLRGKEGPGHPWFYKCPKRIILYPKGNGKSQRF